MYDKDRMQERIEECMRNYVKVKEAAVISRDHYITKALTSGNELAASREDINPIHEIKNEPKQQSAEPAIPAYVKGGEVIYAEDEPVVLGDALKKTALKFPDKTIVCINESGERISQTYSELLTNAEKILTGLRKHRLAPLENLIFLFDRSDYFLEAFWGCILGGIVSVPITIPKDLSTENSETTAFVKIWEMLDKPKIFTSFKVADQLKQLTKNFNFNMDNLLYIEDLKQNKADKNWYQAMEEETAIILYTSGSTGLPKGVIQTHKSILARERGTTLFNGFTSDEISVNWMTIEHVASIVMFHVKEVYLGCSQIQVRTEYILNKPLRWLDLLSEFRATITWAPNFAFDLINKSLEQAEHDNWELSSLRVITNAAEAINSNTTKKFLKLLKPYKLDEASIKPSWGMSETCSCTIYSNNFTAEKDSGIRVLDKGSIHGRIKEISKAEQNSTIFVELGVTIPGMDMRIADELNKTVSEGIVGKLQVKGDVVTKGYYRNDEINKTVFVEDGWFETGDLAFIKDGRVTLTGRAKEIIIINGIHYANSEIEGIVNLVNGVKITFSAACSVLSADVGRELVLIFFVPEENEIESIISTIEEIKLSLLQKMGIAADYIIPIKKEEFPRTNIGKIQRSKLIERYNNGYYDEILKEISGYGTEEESSYGIMKVVWEKSVLTEANTGLANQNILLFMNMEQEGDSLTESLTSSGAKCIKVYRGSQFERKAQDIYYLSETDVSGYQKLFQGLKENGIVIHNIIHLWNYREKYNAESIEEMRLNQYLGVYSLLHILKELNTVIGFKGLYLISAETAKVIPCDGIDFEKTSVSGLIKTAAIEMKDIKICQMDMEIKDSLNLSQYVIREIENDATEGYVCYRNGERYVQRLMNLDMVDENITDSRIRRYGVYIITGGLGGIGFEVSKFLLSCYQVNLIILGKTNFEKGSQAIGKKQKLQELSDYGEVEYYSVDISDYSLMNQLVQDIELKYKEKISGVFHLAGMDMEHYWDSIEEYSIRNDSADNFEKMFQAKVYGAWVIKKIFEKNNDCFLLFFSSVNSYFGGNCVGAYSSANSFLYGIVNSISDTNNCMSLSWSTWKKTGINKNNVMSAAAKQKGFQEISVQDGIEMLNMVTKKREPHLFIGLDINNINIYNHVVRSDTAVKYYYVFYTADSDNLSNKEFMEIIKGQGIQEDIRIKFLKLDEIPKISDSNNIDYETLFSKSFHNKTKKYIPPKSKIEIKLYEIWRDILKFNQIGVNTSFFDCGGSSINVHLLLSKINEEFKLNLMPSELYKNSRIDKLAALIEKITQSTGCIETI